MQNAVNFRQYWPLNSNIVFLNHGAFGACPIKVLEQQNHFRQMMEADPTEFFFNIYPSLLEETVEILCDFVNANPANMSLQTNATTGVNTIMRSLDLREGDEIILCDHTYQACRNAIEFVCAQAGAKVIEVSFPFNGVTDDQILESYLGAITSRTRLVFMDTVTSPTALLLPFEKVIHSVQSRGIDVLLDASHGIGLLPLDFQKLNAAYIVGNCHKWLCTPKGSAFLYARDDKKNAIRPLSISHGYFPDDQDEQRFLKEFSWNGTFDPSAWLSIPFAIDYLGGLVDGGWDEIMNRNHSLTVKAREIICDAFNLEPPTADSMLSAMFAIELPLENKPSNAGGFNRDPLVKVLYEEFQIQLSVIAWSYHNARYLRVSTALYNNEDDILKLIDALRNFI